MPKQPKSLPPAMEFMRTCTRCGCRYDWRKSTSRTLKMTYCNSLCEFAGLGFTIEGLLRVETARAARPAQRDPEAPDRRSPEMSALPVSPANNPTHVHHWLIEEANGPLSRGICKTCGELRAFRNWIEEIDFASGKDWHEWQGDA